MTDQANQKRVVVTLPVLLVGGTEVQTLQQVRVLVDAGYRVTACCFFQYADVMCAEMEKTGAQVVLLGADRSAGLWSLLRRLVAFFRQERPDIVHVQYMAPGFIPVLAARLAGVRTVFATVHQPGRPYGRKSKFLLRTAARLCTAFFCNSRAVEESWFGDSALIDPSKLATRHHWTIYNAVDIDKIAVMANAVDVPALRNQFGLGAGPVIGCVGRLRNEKGQALLLEAFAELVKLYSEVRLLMVGDGPDCGLLEMVARSLGIAEKVIWLGARPSNEVFRLYGIMDILAVPSQFEGFGLTAAEAMAVGLPVVASHIDGLAEVVADKETGLLVSPGDSAAMATALDRLLNEPETAHAMGRSGLERVQRMFSLQRYADATLAAYRQATGSL